MERRSYVLPVRIGDTMVHARVAKMDHESAGLEGEAMVAARIPSFDSVATGIKAMAKELSRVIEKIAPDKVCFEFNVGISMDSGKLVALFFDTEATGSMKVSLEWCKSTDKVSGSL